MNRLCLTVIFSAFGLAMLVASTVAADDSELRRAMDSLPTIADADISDLETRIRRLRGQSGSPSRDLLLARGREAAQSGAHEQAIDTYSALIDYAPDFAEAYYARADMFFMQGFLGMALADLSTTLQHDPRHFDAIYLLAIVQMELERYDAAHAALDALERVHPRFAPAFELREELAYRDGRMQL